MLRVWMTVAILAVANMIGAMAQEEGAEMPQLTEEQQRMQQAVLARAVQRSSPECQEQVRGATTKEDISDECNDELQQNAQVVYQEMKAEAAAAADSEEGVVAEEVPAEAATFSTAVSVILVLVASCGGLGGLLTYAWCINKELYKPNDAEKEEMSAKRARRDEQKRRRGVRPVADMDDDAREEEEERIRKVQAALAEPKEKKGGRKSGKGGKRSGSNKKVD